MANDLIFKYGTGNLPESNAGTVYIKKSGNTKADMYIDSPETNSQRLRVGSDVYVGDPEDTEANDYEVVINPNGDVLEGIVTGLDSSENPMAYTIRVVEVEESALDSYTPTDADGNIITLVIKS